MRHVTTHNGTLHFAGKIRIRTHTCHVAVVGSGAAGMAAALRLAERGVPDVMLLTEDLLAGTSRNTGSDKQTYYKLTLSGQEPDSVGRMAQTLFAGGSMDGDLARIEAALSAECFYWLAEKGVPFPRNAYGEAVGYKTDHDPLSRASSAGPLTSRLMVEHLQDALDATPVALFDRQQAVKLLTDGRTGAVRGVLCLSLDDPQIAFNLIMCPAVVWAVGGPALVYADVVYPGSQLGGTAPALEAGAAAVNLTEWQYGLASVAPRWNVSGSYQQVLPSYVSTDPDGGDPRHFLAEGILDRKERLGAIFRKGYQWPFDVRKLPGSSLVDLLVYRETALRGRRVFLDFRQNPDGLALDRAGLDAETADYLDRTHAWAPLPWQRLCKMNEPAYAFYLEHGVDLSRDRLEIRLSAQHHNGGLAVDAHWETTLPGLFAVGEVSGTHGVYRPGGSALNSGQVGALRAADAIARRLPGHGDAALDEASLLAQAADWLRDIPETEPAELESELLKGWNLAGERMSRLAGPLRDTTRLQEMLGGVCREIASSRRFLAIQALPGRALACRFRDMLLTQRFLLGAMCDYLDRGGVSRGSALYLEPGGRLPGNNVPDVFRARTGPDTLNDRVQRIRLETPGDLLSPLQIDWRPVHPLPQPDEAFEVVWQAWRKDRAQRGRGKHET
ncbi:MAG: FAD-binding protein [Eubacteriales bacterium]|nr:FAD-binding protein [Eubacteriales bacterium]